MLEARGCTCSFRSIPRFFTTIWSLREMLNKTRGGYSDMTKKETDLIHCG